jgi:hypothetical protein
MAELWEAVAQVPSLRVTAPLDLEQQVTWSQLDALMHALSSRTRTWIQQSWDQGRMPAPLSAVLLSALRAWLDEWSVRVREFRESFMSLLRLGEGRTHVPLAFDAFTDALRKSLPHFATDLSLATLAPERDALLFRRVLDASPAIDAREWGSVAPEAFALGCEELVAHARRLAAERVAAERAADSAAAAAGQRRRPGSPQREREEGARLGERSPLPLSRTHPHGGMDSEERTPSSRHHAQSQKLRDTTPSFKAGPRAQQTGARGPPSSRAPGRRSTGAAAQQQHTQRSPPQGTSSRGGRASLSPRGRRRARRPLGAQDDDALSLEGRRREGGDGWSDGQVSAGDFERGGRHGAGEEPDGGDEDWRRRRSDWTDAEVHELRAQVAAERRRSAGLQQELESTRQNAEQRERLMQQDNSERVARLEERIFQLNRQLNERGAEQATATYRELVRRGLELKSSFMDQGSVAKMQAEMRSMEQLVEGLNKENARLAQDLKTAQARIKGAEHAMFLENRQLQQQNDELRERLAQVEQTPFQLAGDKASEEIRRLKAALANARRNGDASRQEISQRLEELRRERDELHFEVAQLRRKLGQGAGSATAPASAGGPGAAASGDAKRAPAERVAEAEEQLAKLRAEKDADIAALQRKLQWYVENQEIIDSYARKLEEQKASEQALRTRIGELEDELVHTHSGANAAGSHASGLVAHRRAADLKRIKELEGEVEELRRALRTRHPDSVAELIRATKEDSQQVRDLKQSVARLEKALSEKDDELLRKLRSLRQQHEQVKLGYEQRIADLTGQLKRIQDLDDASETKSEAAGAAAVASSGGIRSKTGRAAARIRELEKQIDDLRAFYMKKLGEKHAVALQRAQKDARPRDGKDEMDKSRVDKASKDKDKGRASKESLPRPGSAGAAASAGEDQGDESGAPMFHPLAAGTHLELRTAQDKVRVLTKQLADAAAAHQVTAERERVARAEAKTLRAELARLHLQQGPRSAQPLAALADARPSSAGRLRTRSPTARVAAATSPLRSPIGAAVQAPALLQLTTERDEAIAKVRSLEQRLRQLQQELVRAAPRALVSKVESLETRLEEKERELRRVLGDTRHLEDTAHAAEVQRLEALLAERDRQIVQFQRELDGFVEALAELQGAQAPELAM